MACPYPIDCSLVVFHKLCTNSDINARRKWTFIAVSTTEREKNLFFRSKWVFSASSRMDWLFNMISISKYMQVEQKQEKNNLVLCCVLCCDTLLLLTGQCHDVSNKKSLKVYQLYQYTVISSRRVEGQDMIRISKYAL